MKANDGKAATEPGRAMQTTRAMRAKGLALALVAALATMTTMADPPTPAAAQPAAPPPHAWTYPFCGAQPVINAVFDHAYPTYRCPPNGQPGCRGDNAAIHLYNDTIDNRRAYEGHNGWDFATRGDDASNLKRPVLAVADGRVAFAGWDRPGDATTGACAEQAADHERGYGLAVRLDHGGVQSLYGHLSALHVAVGDTVAAGQTIGSSGSTGNSTGPHLHFGAFTPFGPDIANGVDPYGWNADWTGWVDRPLPAGADPWRRAGGPASPRLLLPGAPDPRPCAALCGPTIVVDDLDPGFTLGCAVPPCGWQSHALGWRSHLLGIRPAGTTADHWAVWQPSLPPGAYAVEAFVPAATGLAAAHAARYRLGDGPEARDVVVDQHEEGAIWVGLGIHRFRRPPAATLSNASFIADNWIDASDCRRVIADAVRFTAVCDPADAAGPAATPNGPTRTPTPTPAPTWAAPR